MGERDDKQRARALKDLALALGGGAAEPAVEALVKLPAADRPEHVSKVADLLSRAVAADFAARSWGRLAFWAARAEKEPALFGAPAGDELRWALFWGRARGSAWAKAAEHLEALAPRLPAALLAALRAYVASAGAPPPEALSQWAPPAAPAPAPQPDLRMGYDRGRAPGAEEAPGPEAPATADEVEGAVLSAWALGFGRFSKLVDRWAAKSAGLARPLRLLAARLSVRELATRARAADPRWTEPAWLIASACEDLGYPAELRDAAALVLRVAIREEDRAGEAERVLAVCRAAGAALGYPELLPLASAAFGDLPQLEPAGEEISDAERRLARAVVALGEKLLQAAPDPDLFFQVLGPWEHYAADLDAPRWLERSLAGLLDARADLAGAFGRQPRQAQKELAQVLADAFPVALAERALDALWAAGDEARPALARGVGSLLDRLRPVPRSLTDEQVAEGIALFREMSGTKISESELRSMMTGLEHLAPRAGAEPDGGLAGKGLELWRRFRDRVLPYDVEYLELALEDASGAAACEEALARYLAKRGDAEALFDELCVADAKGCQRAREALEARLLERHAADAEGLAAALLKASRAGAPRRLTALLANALARAAGPAATRSPKVKAALREAKLLSLGPRKRKAARRGPPRKAKKAPGTGGQPREGSRRARKKQLELFGGGGRGTDEEGGK